MPILLYNLELTEEELTCVWVALSVLDLHKPPKPVSPSQARVDAGLVSALAKVDKLMQSPKQ
jgi:hypothetical protein